MGAGRIRWIIRRKHDRALVWCGGCWTTNHPFMPVRKLVAEVERRIFHCHALLVRNHGQAVEGGASCVRSRGSSQLPFDAGAEAGPASWVARGTLPDVVLGDRDGSTCAPALTTLTKALIADAFERAWRSPSTTLTRAWNWSAFWPPQDNRTASRSRSTASST